MIVLRNLTKVFVMQGRRKVVADNINVTFPTGTSVGLLGRNGAGKSTLLQMIAGTTHATAGEVLSTGSISFPVGLASALHKDMTGAQNTRFVARIYGADSDALVDYVQDFAELGEHFHLPVRSYSSGMRGRLSFGINMGLDFDTYLIDEVTAVGDASFKRKSKDVFLDRMKNAGSVFVSHSMGQIRQMCDAGAVLEDGKLVYYDDVDEAIDRYMQSVDDGPSVQVAALEEHESLVDFPKGARMTFGLGAPHTLAGWLSDCLRRNQACHFPPTREPHYFDVRAGLNPGLFEKRLKVTQDTAGLVPKQKGTERRGSVRQLAHLSRLMAFHAAPLDGADRHDSYIDFLISQRRDQPLICDFTHDYAILGERDFTEMAMIGGSRFVMVLRDPATRFWAHLWERQKIKGRDEEALIEAVRTLSDDQEQLRNWPAANYAGTIAALESAVDPSRICYVFHERLTEPSELDRVFEFLGIPPTQEHRIPPMPEDDLPKLPPRLRTKLRKMLSDQYKALRARFGAENLPEEWADRALSDRAKRLKKAEAEAKKAEEDAQAAREAAEAKAAEAARAKAAAVAAARIADTEDGDDTKVPDRAKPAQSSKRRRKRKPKTSQTPAPDLVSQGTEQKKTAPETSAATSSSSKSSSGSRRSRKRSGKSPSASTPPGSPPAPSKSRRRRSSKSSKRSSRGAAPKSTSGHPPST